jgi:hypothetical protein
MSLANTEPADLQSLDIDQLRAKVEELIDLEIIDGLDEWRISATEGDTQEVYEWWLVTDFFAHHLDAIGEPVLINDYGNWWGHTCTGQSVMLHGTLQVIARRLLRS